MLPFALLIVGVTCWSPIAQAQETELRTDFSPQKLSAALASGSFGLEELDAVWENRAKLHGPLVEYAKSTPEIPDEYQSLFRVSQLLAYIGHFVSIRGASQSKFRSDAFLLGYQVAKRATQLEPEKVEGHYWYAINLAGYAANEGVISLLENAGQILDSLDKAVLLSPDYFFCGPLRSRGRFYFKMPGSPISIGEMGKAFADLKKAVAKSPDIRINMLYYAEMLASNGNEAQALEIINQAKAQEEHMGAAEEATVTKRLAELERSLK